MKSLVIDVASDIHLGHKRTKAEHIIRNLRECYADDAKFAEIDLLVFAGDVFDNLLYLPGNDVPDIDAWIVNVLWLAKKHNVKIRVLEGTPSHEYKQLIRFETLNKVVGINADLKYVSALSIEKIEDLGITVLYVPDEWDEDPQKTFEQVQVLLRKHELEQVDFAFMHGQFEYQLPEQVKAPKHNSQQYLSIVKYLIFIGHVHNFSQFDRITAQGSFDRLAHGEEHPKGHVRAYVSDDEMRVEFIENKGAKIYKTIDVTDKNMDRTLKLLERGVKDIPEDSYIRVQCQSGHEIAAALDVWAARNYPLYNWSLKTVAADEKQVREILPEMDYAMMTLTKDNIVDKVMEAYSERTSDTNLVQEAKKLLQGCL